MSHLKYHVFVLFVPYKIDGLVNTGWQSVSHYFTFQAPGVEVKEINEIVQKEIDKKSNELITKYADGFGVHYKATSLSITTTES